MDQNKKTTAEEAEERKFDSFCRTVIQNEAKDAYRENARRVKKEVSLASMTPQQTGECYTEDTYHTSDYERIYYVGNIRVPVRDEALGETLKFLIPQRRDVILLGFILGKKDKEIAQILHVCVGTVVYRRKAALIQIRQEVEAWDHVRNKD